MKSEHHDDGIQITLRLWSLPEVEKAMPYLRAVMKPLRDQWLEIQRARLVVRRLADSTDFEANNADVIHDAKLIANLAEDRFTQTLNELIAFDVYTLDPLRGIALLPFKYENELAWFVFDLFAPEGLDAWRLHSDPLEARRSMQQLRAA
jgi:hypothetical protein